jgi:hypothetical protein
MRHCDELREARLKQTSLGITGTGWCGGIRVDASATSLPGQACTSRKLIRSGAPKLSATSRCCCR